MDISQVANIYAHGRRVDRGRYRVECNYCGKQMSSITRLRHHLGGVGPDVKACAQVPAEVKEFWRDRIIQNYIKGDRPSSSDGAKRKKRDTSEPSTSQNGGEDEIHHVLEDNATKHIIDINETITAIEEYIPRCMQLPTPQPGNMSISTLGAKFIRKLPEFGGRQGEDPLKHLENLNSICTAEFPSHVDLDLMKMRAFGCTLEGDARNWLDSIPDGCITKWGQVVNMFLTRYTHLLPSKILYRRNISNNAKQRGRECFIDYFRRFKILVKDNPQHGWNGGFLLTKFYEGLHDWEKQILDGVAGKCFTTLNPNEALHLVKQRFKIDMPEGVVLDDSIMGTEF